MRFHRQAGTLVLMILLLQSCGDSSGGPSVTTQGYTYVAPSPALCDAALTVSGGFLCAVSPSRLDARARDIFGSESVADTALGFGFHAVAFPDDGTNVRGVYMHFAGSYGRPYDESSAEFPSETFLQESLTSGYLMLQIAYHNRYAVNSADECAGSINVDDCAGRVRREKITGEDLSAVTDVPLADSIEERIVKLVAYFEGQGFQFPVEVVSNGQVHWNNVRVGGHSQGAGHALYLAKYFGGAHACLLAGAYDVPDEVPGMPAELIADWYLDNGAALDLTGIRAIVSVDDANYTQFTGAYGVLSLQQNHHWKAFSAAGYFDANGQPVSGHAAAVNDPAFQSLRYTACFSDAFF